MTRFLTIISMLLIAFTAMASPESAGEVAEAGHTEGLIADLAWILVLGAVSTLIFKKLKQPVILGYILAGFLASPKFEYLPSISNLDNIEFWAELGIVIIMFTLGLEFSFKKLMNAGSSAVGTALIIITGMTFAGYGVGALLGFSTINSIFLGGMISMSSTTIIIKSLDDLGMRQKKFASLVLAVLIIEDLFAVLMLVLLSSLAVGEVQGMELIYTVGKLLFFLIIWFVVGVYILPTFLTRSRMYLNDETLLIVSMGLCFVMAIFSVSCGFSLELGAFVTGSILAGTTMAERIESVVQPVKDLFGAVFFISVGMMVDPGVIAEYWSQILILAVVVICGMIIFGTAGMLVTGQTLRIAVESGFTLTQIGEFSFIIASLGMSLGVLKPSLYPIIVAVSVITIFTTPYFIKMADPAYRLIEKHLPKGLNFLIERYSKQESDSNETRQLWKDIISRYLWRIVLYSVLLTAIVNLANIYLFPFMISQFADFGKALAVAITLIAMSPFLIALSYRSTRPHERIKLHSSAAFYDVPLVVMAIVRYLVALFFIVWMVSLTYSTLIGWLCGIGYMAIIILLASTRIKFRYRDMERKFLNNLNVRENTRTGANNKLVSDIHLAHIRVGASAPFVGDRLIDSHLRRDYGISVYSITRGEQFFPLPNKETRIFPGDIIGIIGTDDQIKHLNDDIERHAREAQSAVSKVRPRTELCSIRLTSDSPLAGHSIGDTNLRDEYHSMIVKIRRGDNDYMNPRPDTRLEVGDTVWIAGDPKLIQRLK